MSLRLVEPIARSPSGMKFAREAGSLIVVDLESVRFREPTARRFTTHDSLGI